MSTLVLMMGLPGAGKSTWAKTHMGDNDIYISRDAIRFSLVGANEEYFSKETSVFDQFVASINEALAEGFAPAVYADATHLNRASRQKLLNRITAPYDRLEIVFINNSVPVCLDQNESRKGTRAYVPKGVIRRMSCSLEEPCFREGKWYYDAITIVSKEPHERAGSYITTRVLSAPERK